MEWVRENSLASSYPFFLTWSAQSGGKPMKLLGGQGSHFETDQGTFLDLGAMIYQANLGHGHPRMVQAIKDQAEELCLTFPNAIFPAKTELAERLLKLAPPGFDRVFFTLGGAEATENAMKMARLVTGRHKFISRYRSYHGATLGALTLSGDYRRPPLEPLVPGGVHAMDCYCDRCPFGQKLESCHLECAQHIEQILELDGKGTFAAVFLEPIPGANGVLIPPTGYWKRIREACDQHGTLLVADEVLTGFGRTGRWFGIDHEQGVVPDMITLAKGLTGGYATLGAVLVHERVSRHFDEQVLLAGLTGYAHPISCAVALEALKIYEEEKLITAAAELESVMLRELREIDDPRVKFVRGRGLLGVLELELEDWPALSAAVRAEKIYVHLKPKTGMIVLSPPLCISEAELVDGIRRLGKAIASA